MTTTLDRLDAADEAPRDVPGGSVTSAAKRKPASKRVPLRRLVDWRVLVAGLVAGGVLHIALVLAAPRMATTSATARLRPALPANRAVQVPAPTPGRQLLPFMLPDALYMFCRFDLTADSLRVSASLLEAGWVLSLHSAQGDNFYVMPAQQKQTDITFLLVPGIGSSETTVAPRRMGGGEVQVAAPTVEGFVVVRAPLKGLAYRAETEAVLNRTTCAPVKR